MKTFCIECKKPIVRRAKRCSRCFHLSTRGRSPWNKGTVGVVKAWWLVKGLPSISNTGRTCFKKGEFTGENNHNWKGDSVSYRTLHNWVSFHLGKPDTCEFCGIRANGHKIHWANKSKEYKRDENDWLRLCAKCHLKYDGYKRWGFYG